MAVPGSGWIDLAWDANSEPDLAGYHVYRSTESGQGLVQLTDEPVVATSYQDASAPSGTTSSLSNSRCSPLVTYGRPRPIAAASRATTN